VRGVSKIEFGKVTVKVLPAHVMVGAVDRPLELREVVLGLVGACPVSDVLTREMVHEGVARESVADDPIRRRRVRLKVSLRWKSVGLEHLAERLAADVCNDSGPNLARLAGDQGHNRRLVGYSGARLTRPVSVSIGGAPANPSFVRDNSASHAGQRLAGLHGLADAVEQVPRSLRGQVVLALDLSGRDTVLGGAQFEYDEDPSAERNLGPVHHRSGQDRELLAASAALPDSTLRHRTPRRLAADAVLGIEEVVVIDAPTMRARWLTAAPAQLLKELVRIGLGRDSLGDGENVEFHNSIMGAQSSFVK